MTCRSILALGGLIAALGCSSNNDPDVPREIGVILPGLSGVEVIEAPDTVSANKAFAVVVNTFGTQCTTPTGVALRLDPAQAHITPYDLVTDDVQACTRDYGPRPHPVQVILTEAGAAEIVVRGVSVGGTAPGRSIAVVRKAVWVRP